MQIRDRIKELRRVPAAELRPNPRNWRTHSVAQRDALQGVLTEVGYAGRLLARELPYGSLELIDGHLRAETTPDIPVPVLVLDVTEEEARLILATFDPLTALAETNSERLDELLRNVQTDNEAVAAMLETLTGSTFPDAPEPTDAVEQPTADEAAAKSGFEVIVTCDSEEDQRRLYDRMTSEGRRCRVLTF